MADPREGPPSTGSDPSDVPSYATHDDTEQEEHQFANTTTTYLHLGPHTADLSERLLQENLPLSAHTNVQPVRGESPVTEMAWMHGQEPKSKFSSDSTSDTDHNDNSTDSEHNDNAEDEDWEKVEKEEFDATTQQQVPLPSVVLKDPSFKATMQEYMGRYKMSDEAKENLKGAWEILKMAGEFGYAVVSEPVMDAAAYIVRERFDCDLDDLPAELRARIMATLPENVQIAIRTTNRTFRPSGGFILPPVAHGGQDPTGNEQE